MTQAAYTYDAAYEAGYNAAIRNIYEANARARRINAEKAKAIKEEKREAAIYFLKQKLAGAALLAFSVAGIIVTGGEFAVALVTVPLSLVIMLTKHRIFN